MEMDIETNDWDQVHPQPVGEDLSHDQGKISRDNQSGAKVEKD